MQWRLLVLLTGLILDHTNVPEDNDDIVTNMRMHELQEGANLVQEPEAVATTPKDHLETHSVLRAEDQDLGHVKTSEPHQPELQVEESSSKEDRFTESETETKSPEPPPVEHPDTEDAEQSENGEPSGVGEEHSPQQEVVTEHHQHRPPEEPEPELESQNRKLADGEVDDPEMSENVVSDEADEETRPSQSDVSDPDMNSKASEVQGASHRGEQSSETEKQPSQSDVSDPDMNSKASEVQGASGEQSSEAEKQPSHSGISDPGHAEKQSGSNVGIRSQTKPGQSQTSNNSTDFMWHLLNIYSVFSVIAYLYGRLKGNSRDGETPEQPQHRDLQAAAAAAHAISAEISVPDRETLTGFYDRYVHVAPHESRRVCEFVEGFVDDLLAAVRETSGDRADVEVDDFVEVGSLYETWCTGKTLTCDLWVPVTPREPYSFQAQLSPATDQDGHADEVRSGYGRVKVREGGRGAANGCPCGQTGEDNDMLCLLHTHEKKEEKRAEVTDAIDAPLCCENTPFLSRTDVAKWFRSAVRKAWEQQMSHKYELELTFRNRDSPGALRIRFRSGKAVHFNVTPVVKFEDTDVCLVSCLGPKRRRKDGEPEPEPVVEAQRWPLSFARYEKSLLALLGRRLPPDACHLRCLRILSFLHKTQVGITGESGLSSHHLKTAVLRLLLDKAASPSEWGPEHLAGRLRDVLELLKTSLRERWLGHALVGNPLVPRELGLPANVRRSKPVNVLQPLLSQERVYTRTVQHFEEMLRNMPVLIKEYMDIPNKGNSSS
ncbi:inositol 1,4,5-trisphosphate receptor-interacting protein [Sardina pilchardus]|uniref:inositol 1,4,5-trisphosphate receptor-interacting protein n=1 Tax=Sardina pilchardus TaxID=27697 RepID=UPI002E110F1B